MNRSVCYLCRRERLVLLDDEIFLGYVGLFCGHWRWLRMCRALYTLVCRALFRSIILPAHITQYIHNRLVRHTRTHTHTHTHIHTHTHTHTHVTHTYKAHTHRRHTHTHTHLQHTHMTHIHIAHTLRSTKKTFTATVRLCQSKRCACLSVCLSVYVCVSASTSTSVSLFMFVSVSVPSSISVSASASASVAVSLSLSLSKCVCRFEEGGSYIHLRHKAHLYTFLHTAY